MKAQAYLLLAISVPNLVLGSFILLRNLKDKTNRFFSGFAFSVGLWALGLAGFIFSSDETIALLWARGYYMAAASIALFFAGFCFSYTNLWPNFSKTTRALIYIPSILIGIMLVFYPQLLMTGIRYNDWGKEVILNWQGYTLYTVYFIAHVIPGFIVLYKGMVNSRGVDRIYLKYIFSGMTIAFALGATFNLFYPAAGNYRYIWVGPLFTVFYVAFISYAIVKHKLFDIRFFVARSLGYALSIFAVAAIYGLATFLLFNTIIFERINSELGQSISYTVLAVLISFTFQPLKRFFDRVTNKYFYKDAYESQELLNSLNSSLVSVSNVEDILEQTCLLVEQYIKPSYVGFFVEGAGGGYSKHYLTGQNKPKNIDTVEKIASKMPRRLVLIDEDNDMSHELHQKATNSNIGLVAKLSSEAENSQIKAFIVLGQKKSGSLYSSQDSKVMEIIADELVIAIQNALRFEEIQQFNVTLQKKVDDATRKLRHANEKLIALDQTKDDFISMASHQLRTPLTSIKGYVSMVIEGDVGKVSKQQHKLLDQAFLSSQRMVYLIADLLNVSRLKTGKFVIDQKPTNLVSLVEGELEQLKESAKNRKLNLTFEKPKTFPDLMMDETKTRQVVMNFADNAIYYTPAGGNIKVAVVEKPETIEFTVTDNGIGVPKSEQHNLFSKFYRAGNARKARPDGTGLGLFMAKKVIIAQGGTIIFKTKEGKGSTFGFSFNKNKLKVPKSTEVESAIKHKLDKKPIKS